MPDTTDVATTSVTIPIWGVDREFGFLNTYDKAEFTREYRKWRKAALLENLKSAGVEPADIAATLNDFDADPPDFVEWLKDKSGDGQLFVFRLSLRKKYPAEVDAIMQTIDLDSDAAGDLVLKLFGRFVKVGEAQAAAAPSTSTYGDGGDDPNGKAPETYQTPPAA